MRARRIAALLLAGMLVLPSVPARAQDDLQNAFITATDQTLTPQSSHYDFYYNVPRQWQVREAWFDVHFRHSNTLLREFSSLSLLVDGSPYATVRLTPENEGGGTLRAVIPAARLTPGFHQFTVAAHLRSQREACENMLDPANWLVLERSSLIHVSYGSGDGAPHLGEFPFPFVQESGPNPWRVDVVVPDAATDGELETAYRVVANLARAQREQSATVNVIRVSEWDTAAHQRHAVFVGKAENLPAVLRIETADIPAEEGLLRELSLPNGRVALVVTGRTEKEVEVAGEALAYPQLVRQFEGASAAVAASVLAAAREQALAEPRLYAQAEKGHVTLKQMGYGEVTLSGAQSASASYVFRTPPNWKYTQGAGARLHVRYSQTLDSKRSALIASVNGGPVVSRALQPGTAKGMDLFVPFPSDLQPGEEVRVTLLAEMYLDANGCLDNEQTMKRYVTIDPDSSQFILPHVEQHSAALAAFPSAFLTDGGELADTTVVLPAEPSSAELTAVARAVTGAAGVAEETRRLRVRHAGEMGEAVAGNVWVVDTAGNNAQAGRMAEAGELAVRSTPDGLSSGTVPIAAETQQGGGIVQQVFRPEGGVALMMAAPQGSALLDAATMLSAKIDIPSEAAQAGAIRTTTGQTVLVDIPTEPNLPLHERLANRVAETYGYLMSARGRLTLYGSAFALTFLVILGSIWLTWRRATVPRKVKQRKRK